MMRNLIIKETAVGSWSWHFPSPSERVRVRLFHGLAVLSLLGYLFLSSTTSAQSIPILTFDSFEKYLHPTSDTIYVINFWATWCKPCVEELPAFEKLHETYKDKKVKVMLVSLDFRSLYEKKVVPFVAKNELKSDVLLLDTQGDNSFIDKVNPKWQGTIPATTIKQGSSGTDKFYERQFTFAELENIIKPLIKMQP